MNWIISIVEDGVEFTFHESTRDLARAFTSWAKQQPLVTSAKVARAA